VFVSSPGSPLTVFRRAIRSGSSRNALLAATSLGRLDLGDALALCLLLRDDDPGRYGRAAARWQSRAVAEVGAGLDEAALLGAALASLRSEHHVPTAEAALRAWCEAHGLRDAARELEEWSRRRAPRRGPTERA
jgi:hypothetical protein